MRPGWPGGGSGARAGDLYRQLLAVNFLVAWLSLASQVRVLIGARGLMPLADFIATVRDRSPPLSFADFPTLLWWAHGDGALLAGTVAGAVLALGAFAGFWPRLCFLLSTALYLSYATACRTFLSFQWDNLLLECGLLACFLPAGRAAPLTHFLFRLVLFKLYFESGIAKWQSPLHDWHDGSAMTFYYETAPLPTWLGWWAHNLPAAWHHFESRATLALELVVPFAIFGPRRPRLVAAVLLTGFQILNIATANYGFFCYLALALHVFLLDDSDIQRAGRRLSRSWLARLVPTRIVRVLARRRQPVGGAPSDENVAAQAGADHLGHLGRLTGALGLAGAAIFVFLSGLQALFNFTEPAGVLARLEPVLEATQAFRLINTYHLFAAITRERIEPELQTSTDGGRTFVAHDLWHKAGAPARAPDFVAPHQPRVDFQLWFYGLDFQRRQPAYVLALVDRLCSDPAAVGALFRRPLPEHPDAVRIAYWRYQFTTPDQRRATGDWWRREWIGASRSVPCDR